MATKRASTPLTQREVQEQVLALVRLATVWARRSFEDDEPRDRPVDEHLLRQVVTKLVEHRDVPLVRAPSGSLVRESSLAEIRLYRLVLAAIRKYRATPAKSRRPLSRYVGDAFRRSGYRVTPELREFIDEVRSNGSPSSLAGRILARAGFKSYRSIAAFRKAAANARAIRRRRSVTRREVIEYFLACLQVPSADLAAMARAIDSVALGGTLTATPRWTLNRRRHPKPSTSFTISRRPPIVRVREGAYYVRYAQPLPGDPTRAELDGVDVYDSDAPFDEQD